MFMSKQINFYSVQSDVRFQVPVIRKKVMLLEFFVQVLIIFLHITFHSILFYPWHIVKSESPILGDAHHIIIFSTFLRQS